MCLVWAAACSHVGNRPEAPGKAQQGQPASPPNPQFLQHGYSLKAQSGDWVYCRRETPTGSILQHTVCKSERELLQEQASTQGMLDAAKRKDPMPSCSLNSCPTR